LVFDLKLRRNGKFVIRDRTDEAYLSENLIGPRRENWFYDPQAELGFNFRDPAFFIHLSGEWMLVVETTSGSSPPVHCQGPQTSGWLGLRRSAALLKVLTHADSDSDSD
jgi:hypothetical protein